MPTGWWSVAHCPGRTMRERFPRLLPVLAVALAACSTPRALPADEAGDPLPRATGSYAGVYRVPTVSDELAAAATFPIESADWTVTGELVTLHYDLPVGLVGGDVDVTLTGVLAPGATRAELSGPVGTGSCTARGGIVSCTEIFDNIGTLPISVDVVARAAAMEYRGAVDDRVAVAMLFGSDPIGVLEFDLSMPELDDDRDDDDDDID